MLRAPASGTKFVSPSETRLGEGEAKGLDVVHGASTPGKPVRRRKADGCSTSAP